MTKFDIDRIFEEGYPGLQVAALIGSAFDYLDIVEEHLPVIRDQMTVRFRAQMKRKYPNLTERHLCEEYQGHDWMINGLLGGLLPGSVLIVLWSAFEQGIAITCKYAQKKEGIPLALDGLREQDITRKLQQYLSTLTRKDFHLPHALSDIQELRNLYAHHNGSLEGLSEQRRARIEGIVKASGGAVSSYDKHHLVLSGGYLRESGQKIDQCLTAVLKFVETQYPYTETPKT
jgi:hypothetical protein